MTINRKIKFLCPFLILFLFCGNLFGQEAKTKKELKKEAKEAKKNKPPEKGDIYFTPVPVIGSNPAFGFIYGAGASVSAYLGEPDQTSISSALLGVAFTTLKQTIITVKSTVYTENNNWILSGDWRYLKSSQPTFGLGTGPNSSTLAGNGFEYEEGLFSKPIDEAQTMKFNFYRFYETFNKRVGDNIYLGLGVHVDIFNKIDDQLLDLESDTPVITSFYAYNELHGFEQDNSSLIGVSLNAVYDTRDNQNSAYKGQYANISLKFNPEFLGSTKNSSTLWIEYRKFWDLTGGHKNILGIWGLGNYSLGGILPYLNLPAVSWDQYAKTGRGFTQGRFRGQHWMYGEIELRKHLYATANNPDFLGFVVFANVSTASNNDADIGLFDYFAPAAGVGLRININKKARSNLNLDYAIGAYGSSGFYLRLNETF